MSKPIDLQPFCGNDECRHPYLMRPFTRRGYTYATNGHILVRVPPRSEIPDSEKDFRVERPFDGIECAIFTPLPAFVVPKPDGDCEMCDGRGFEHSCPDCQCTCWACEGSGSEVWGAGTSIEIGGVSFAAKYLLMMQGLPGIAIGRPRQEQSLLFRFDGGEGALMPLRGQCPTHIVAEHTP